MSASSMGRRDPCNGLIANQDLLHAAAQKKRSKNGKINGSLGLASHVKAAAEMCSAI